MLRAAVQWKGADRSVKGCRMKTLSGADLEWLWAEMAHAVRVAHPLPDALRELAKANPGTRRGKAAQRIAKIIISTLCLFDAVPELKKELWGSSLWTSGYYASTVGKHGNETVIANYVKEQGCEADYDQVHKDQLVLL